MMLGASAGRETAAQQAIPDAPTPQPTLPGLNSVVPGEGTTSSSNGDAAGGSTQPAVPGQHDWCAGEYSDSARV
jgi:hypothetical protein